MDKEDREAILMAGETLVNAYQARVEKRITSEELRQQICLFPTQILSLLHSLGYRKVPELTTEQIANERLTFPYPDEPETIDEVVLYNATVHLEQLTDECYMLIVANKRHDWHLNIFSKSGRAKVIATLFEDNSPTQEQIEEANK